MINLFCIETKTSILDINLKEKESILIPTNGIVTKDNKNVMGAGLAKQFKDKYPGIDLKLGHLIKNFGNHVFHLNEFMSLDKNYYSFPTKNDWKSPSELNIIKRSCKEIKNICDDNKIYLPQVGCGCGSLDWELVKPILDDLLDNRFICLIYKRS